MPGESARTDPFARADRALAIRPEQGDLIYLLCRAVGATGAVDIKGSTELSVEVE